MSLSLNLRNPFLQQYFFEIVLPLIGYFFLDWSLAIIAVFYLIDQVASEFSFFRKFKAVSKSENKNFFFLALISIITTVCLIAVEATTVLMSLSRQEPEEFDKIVTELIGFAKEELWLLLPMILLIYYLKDQFTFFMPRRFLLKDRFRFFWCHVIENSLIAILTIAGAIILNIFELHPTLILVSFLLIKIAFDFTVARKLDSISTKK